MLDGTLSLKELYAALMCMDNIITERALGCPYEHGEAAAAGHQCGPGTRCGALGRGPGIDDLPWLIFLVSFREDLQQELNEESYL